MKPWTDQYFGSLYGEIYRKHLMQPERARQEVAFASHVLQLRGKLVLDLAAGYGRHARLLARQARVVALDRNGYYLQQAQAGLKGKAADQLVSARADMRLLPFKDAAFEAVLLLFNSFGYFVDEPAAAPASAAPKGQVWKLPHVFYERQLVSEQFGQMRPPEPAPVVHSVQVPTASIDQNAVVLKEIARVLQPGAQLLLEAPNPKTLIAAVQQHPRRHVITGSYEIEEEYAWNPTRQVLTNRTRFRMRKQEESAQYHLRLYSPVELKKLLQEAGLQVTKTYGDYEGSAFKSGSSEMQLIVATRKPSR